jgi:hypothetical protein
MLSAAKHPYNRQTFPPGAPMAIELLLLQHTFWTSPANPLESFPR